MSLHFPPASRATDPAPSHQAEREINDNGLRGRQQRLVRSLVQRYPGRTSRELARCAGIDRYMVARRLPDLESNGLVCKGSARQCTVTRKSSVVWWVMA